MHAVPTSTQTITFVNNEHFSFAESEVPPTVPVWYAEQPDDLVKVWSDGPLWDPPPVRDFPVCICGRRIPLQYWKQLYSYNKDQDGEWRRLKNSWTNWRYFMQAYENLVSPLLAEVFWFYRPSLLVFAHH
ncbi:hypothetical protein CPB85DRAFT_1444381 [Mucidula mucida]|nr:hypothetical protein CPB85DRAFT_1444381 [Mucidula mucida]